MGTWAASGATALAPPRPVGRPAKVTDPPHRSTFWVVDRLASTPAGGYCEYSQREPTTRLDEATLVSSEVVPGVHAPLLDIDMPAELGLDPHGRYVLWLDRLGAAGWATAVAALSDAGLGLPTGVIDDEAGFRVARATRDQRNELRTRPGWDPIDFDEVHTLLRAVGPGWPGPFHELVSVAMAAVMVGSPRGVRTRAPIPLTDPWPLPLTAPAILLPSTHNLHLYLETCVGESAMFELFDCLAVAGVIEDGYNRASQFRGRAFLRLPWITKDTALGPNG